MKKLGIFIGVLLVTIISPFVVQFGWNEIVTTILPVAKISFWQALGVDALITFINPTIYSDEEISKKLTQAISKIIYFAFVLWLASLFI